MVLSDDFYYQPIRLDTINTQIYADLLAKEGDAGGRGLKVTLTENGAVKNTTGLSLNLKWEHTAVPGLQGLEPFEAVDLTKGIYKLKYPINMLQKGMVKAFIQIIDNGGLAGSRNLKIKVDSTVGDDTAMESSNEFTALVTALVKTNHMENLLNEAIANVTVDSEVITARNSTAKGKTFTVIDERIEEIESDVYFPASNILPNGNFANISGWVTNGGSLTAANNEGTMTITALGENLGLYTIPTTVAGHKYYITAEIYPKFASNLRIGFDDAYDVITSGIIANAWNRRSVIKTKNASGAVIFYHKTNDGNYVVGNTFKFRRMAMIDLTDTFGAGFEPTVEQMDRIMSQFDAKWFIGIGNLSQPALLLAKTLDMEAQFTAAISGVTVDSETINARVGEDSTTHATLKARLDSEKSTTDQSLVSLGQQLEHVVTIGNFTGANDTTKFFNACSNAVANKKILRLTKDITLDATVQNMFEIPSIDGNGFTLTVSGVLHLYIGSACNFINNLNVLDSKSYLKTDFVGGTKSIYDKGFLFETKTGYAINGFSASNVHFKGGPECADGSSRTKGVFYLKGDNIFMKDVSIADSRCGICINDADGSTVIHYDVHFGNITFTNTEQGIWANRTGRIFIDNVSLVNTLTQQGNYTITQGSDLFNFLYCANIEINNFYCNYAIERSIYFIYCNTINVNGFIIDNAGGGAGGGIKFLGVLNVPVTDQPTTSIKVSNGTFTGNGRESCFELYNSKHVEISDIKVNASSGKFAYFAVISNNAKNITIHDCDVRNLEFNFIYGVLSSTLGGNVLSHLYDTISIYDCNIINPVSITASSTRYLIEFYNPDSRDLTDETFFKFYNLTFRNNRVIQTIDGSNIYVKQIEPTSKLGQLISNVRLKHVRYENNEIRGCNSPYGFMYNDPGSDDIIIKGDYAIGASISVPHSTRLYCSSGSEINFIVEDTNGFFRSKASYDNLSGITKSTLNNISETTLDYSPTASEVKYFFYTENGARLYSGHGEIFFEDGLYSKFKVINTAGVLTIAQITGDGTVSSNNLTFANGSQIEFGPTYKELRIRSGATAKKYTITFKAKV